MKCSRTLSFMRPLEAFWRPSCRPSIAGSPCTLPARGLRTRPQNLETPKGEKSMQSYLHRILWESLKYYIIWETLYDLSIIKYSTLSPVAAPLPLDDIVGGADEHREEHEASDDGTAVATSHRNNWVFLDLNTAMISRQGLLHRWSRIWLNLIKMMSFRMGR